MIPGRWCLLLFTLVFSLRAQDPYVFSAAWRATFDSAGSDLAEAITVDAQGNLLIAGQTSDAETLQDGLLVKVDATGQRAWARRFDSTISQNDRFTDVAVDSSGNAAVVGLAADRDATTALLVASYAATNGSTRWLKLFPGPHFSRPVVGVDATGNVYARTALEDGAGQIIRTYKFSATGTAVWTNEISAPRDLTFGFDTRPNLLVEPDGSTFVATLTTSNAGDLDWSVVKLRPDGSQQWQLAIGGTNYETQPLIAFHSSGDLLIAGSSQNDNGTLDLAIERLNPSTGARVWQTKLRGSSSFKAGSHILNDLNSDDAGNIWLAGRSPTWGGFVSRFDSFGNFNWITHFPTDAKKIVPLGAGQGFLAMESGLGWFDDDGALLKFEGNRYVPVVAADANHNVYAADSFYKAEAGGDFGLEAEKLIVDRNALAPKFTSIPQFNTGSPLQNVVLAPEVTGPDLVFTWYHNGAVVPGQTNRVLTINTVDATTIGYYSLSAENSFGGSLTPDIEVLTTTPIFIRQPRSQTFAYDGDVAFSALAAGFEPQLDVSSVLAVDLTYQWYFNGIAIPGETQSKLLIRHADESWIGHYKVRATLFYRDLNLFFYADSDEVTLDWPFEGIDENWRDQFYLTDEPWSLANGMEIKSNGDLALSLQSPYEQVRAEIANDSVLSDVIENFRPAANPTPKGPHFTDSQGNFYTLGETNLVDTGVDWMVSKRSANGTLVWQQSISSLGRQIDNVVDAVVTLNDEIVVTGWSNTAETGRDAFTVCLNKSDGSIRWSAVFDDPAGVRIPFNGETPSGIAIDKNGNIFVAGTGLWPTAPFHFLVSYDGNGAQRFVYERPWSTIADTPPRLAMDPDGNAVMGGTFGIMKVDSLGRELWVSDLRTDLASAPPTIYGIQVDRSGNIYLSGNASGSGAFGKFDAFGHLQVQTIFTGAFPDAYFDPSPRFSVDDYGNVYLSGTGGNIFSEKDIVGVKLNPYLYRYWMVRVDGLAQNLDTAFDMKAQGNDVYLVGSTLVDNTMEASVAKFTQTPPTYLVKDVTSSKTIKRGTTLHLEAQATGNPPFFQWYKDNQPIPGAWAAAVDLPNVTSQAEGFYALQVYDSLGNNAFDAGFAIRVADPPAITTQPVSTNVIVNGQIALSAVASGSEPLFYQWLLNGVAITNATNATLTIDHAQFSNRGDYKLVVSNAWGSATSFAATIKVLAPANLPPIVKITEPADRLVQRDNTVVHLRAAAYDADGRVTQVVYRVNGTIAAVIGVAPFDASWTPPGPGIYKVTATATDNLGAATTSAEIDVVIAPAPVFTKQPPTLLPIAENSDITLDAEATSVPPPRYQWRLNGANIPGATNRTYTISGAQARNSGRYAALAINEGAATISSKTEVIVDAPSLTLTDQFADAVEVSDIQFTGRGNNRNGTKEVGEPNHARRKGGKSVWLRYRAPASGVMTLNTRGSAFDTLLAVYSGGSVTSLTQLAADDERGGFHCSALRFNAVKGEAYNIAVDGFNGQSGNIILSWALDTSSRPLPVITTEPDSVGTGLNGVAAFHVDAVGNGLTFQWFFNGYPVPGATSSGLVLSGVARNNVGDYVVRVTNGDGSVESQEAELELGNGNEPVTQDRVEDLLPNTAGAPKGAIAASFAGYPTISPGVPYRKFFNTAGATADDNEPVLGDGGGASKWFLINAGGNGTLVADTIGSDFPNVITLHDPSDFDALPVLANGVPLTGGASRVTYPATNGLSYLIRVDGVDQAEGNVVLNVTIGSEPAVTSGSLDQVIAAGQSATLNATVTASPAATFQWYLNDNLLPGATAATLQLTNFDPAQVGAYALEAKNALGSVKKTVAYLEIARPVVFSAPAAQANGSITMQIEGNNRTYWIDITQDFINWTNIFSARTDNGALIYTDTPAANQPLGFYRARWQ